MGIFSWILFGLVVGAIAKAIHPGPDPGGWIITILLGIAGAFVGGFIGSFLGWGSINSFSFKNVLLAVAGSIILLWLYRLAKKR